jgi:hypothetical protein
MRNSKNLVKEIIVKDNLEILVKYPILSLFFIGIVALLIRLTFFENDLIYFSDNLTYFKYAIDQSIAGKSSVSLLNDGWPKFVSLFFRILNSNNFLDYMNLQSYLAISISTLTIIPLYYFSKKFVGASFALISTIFFIFEPRIIQNSLIGVTDPLFILLVVTSLVLAIQKNKYLIIISFVIASLSSIVRAEGLFLIPALGFMFLYQFKLSKKSIFQCIIFLLISIIILLPFSIERIENSGNDNLTGRIILSSSSFSEQTENDPNQMLFKISNAIYLLGGFLARLMIPYLLIFVPIGIIIFLKKNDLKKLLLIIPGFFLILPSLYAYSIPVLDSRYLFPILPIICIIGTLSFKKYVEKTKYRKIIIFIILLIIIISSITFLTYKNESSENQKEFLQLARIVNEKTDVILYIQLSPVTSHLDSVRLMNLEKFPTLSTVYNPDSKIKIVKFTSVDDFFPNMEKSGITHIVIDREKKNPIIILEIFDNYNKYKNLKKIFDSEENGFNYKIQIFEIKY